MEKILTTILTKLGYGDMQIYNLLQGLKRLPPVDSERFERWLENCQLEFKGNAVAWLAKVLPQEIEKGTFDRPETIFMPYALLDSFKEKEIKPMKNCADHIFTFFYYIYNNGLINQKEIIELNHQFVEQLAHSGKTSNDYFNLWRNCELAKERNWDWEKIRWFMKEGWKEKWE